MTLGDLVRLAREKKGWSAQHLADKAGVSQPAITRLENGERLGRVDTVLRITATLGIDPKLIERLMTGEDVALQETAPTVEDLLTQAVALLKRERERTPSDDEARYEVLPDNVAMIPLVESFVAAGEGAVPNLEQWPYVLAPGESAAGKFAIRVKGDCLAPRVRDGEVAVVDRNAEPKLDDVVAVQVDGESLLRIYKGDRLISLNGHPPIPIDDRVHLEGVVVFHGGRP